MFTINVPSNGSESAEKITNIDSNSFRQLLKSKWDEKHDQPDVFRYKVNKKRERIVDNRYIVLLNPDRGFKRREPEFIDSIHKPFNPNEFNFNKTSLKEHLFTIQEMNSTDTHLFLVNVSPISRYHTLLCPSVNRCLPQVVTEDSIRLVLKVKFLAQDRDLKIGFNSLCAFASVNHLHYHMMYEKNTFHVATDKCIHIKGPLYIINNIVPAFCFQVTKETISQAVADIFRLTEYFVSKSIGHNILITNGEPVVPGCKDAEMVPMVPGCKDAEMVPMVPGLKDAKMVPTVPECKDAEMVPVVPGCKGAEMIPVVPDKDADMVRGPPGCKNAEMIPVVPGCKDAEMVPMVPGCKNTEVVRVILTPRLSTAGIKMLTSFNVAVLELSGWFPVFNAEFFDTCSSADLEKELSKWRLPNFKELCDEVKLLY